MSASPHSFNLFGYFFGGERLTQIAERTAVEFRDQRISYDELRAETECWADRILELGITKGDRVALLLYDSPEFIACFLAIASLGAVCVPINTFLTSQDVAFILSDSGSRLLIIESDLEDKAKMNSVNSPDCAILRLETMSRSVLKEKSRNGADTQVRHYENDAATTRETPAFLLYTSGSTGAPKGVLHLHGSIPFTVDSYARNVLRLTREDRIFSSSRMFFAYGLGNSLSFPLAAGAAVLLEPERMSAERLARFIETRKPTVFFGVPAVYLSLLDHESGGGRVDLSGVRLCISAGEALPARIFEEWQRRFGLAILDGIGSTEMLHIFISNREEKPRAGSSGTVVEGYAARLVDDEGAEVRANEIGNLWVRGGSSTAGYWNRADLTGQTIRDGWVRTGDIYQKDEEGFFQHVGRSDDCFKVRGLWVSPIEVESVLTSHDSISEAAVVSATDENGLATAVAYVVIRQEERSDALRDEICRFAGSQLPQYKVPSRIEFLEEMPRTATGKIQRYRLRTRESKGTQG